MISLYIPLRSYKTPVVINAALDVLLFISHYVHIKLESQFQAVLDETTFISHYVHIKHLTNLTKKLIISMLFYDIYNIICSTPSIFYSKIYLKMLKIHLNQWLSNNLFKMKCTALLNKHSHFTFINIIL